MRPTFSRSTCTSCTSLPWSWLPSRAVARRRSRSRPPRRRIHDLSGPPPAWRHCPPDGKPTSGSSGPMRTAGAAGASRLPAFAPRLAPPLARNRSCPSAAARPASIWSQPAPRAESCSAARPRGSRRFPPRPRPLRPDHPPTPAALDRFQGGMNRANSQHLAHRPPDTPLTPTYPASRLTTPPRLPPARSAPRPFPRASTASATSTSPWTGCWRGSRKATWPATSSSASCPQERSGGCEAYRCLPE